MMPSVKEEDTNIVTSVPNIVIPADIQYIDECASLSDRPNSRILRGDVGHTSLNCKTRRDSKRLCRHHSERLARPTLDMKPRFFNSSVRRSNHKVRRCASAVEPHNGCYKARVKRSVSDRSNLKHLMPPGQRGLSKEDSVFFDVSEAYSSSRCSRASSSRTIASNASISEVVAFELGFKDIPGLTTKEARRRKAVFVVGAIASTLLVMSVLLVAVTLLLSPAVDGILRKENEEMYRAMSNLPSSAPVVPEVPATTNDTGTATGHPG